MVAAGWDYALELRQADRIERENAVILHAERLMSDMKDAETGQRGFLLTGEEPYLDPYRAALVTVESDISALRDLLGARANTMVTFAKDRLDSAAKGIEMFRSSGRDAAMDAVRHGRGKELMDALRAEVARQQQQAVATIAAVHGRPQVWYTVLRAASILFALLAFGGIAIIALRRRREQQASNALLEGVLENAPIGLGFLDASLRVRHMNHALGRMSERALSAAPGLSIWDIMPQLRDALELRLQQVVEGGRPVANVEVEARSNSKPNDTREYQVSFYPLTKIDEADQRNAKASGGVGMVIADITARKRAERWMRESEERFRTLTKASTSMIWTTDAMGGFAKPQPEWTAFTGQSVEAAMGRGWLDAVHPDDRTATEDAWEEALASKTPLAIEHQLHRADRAWRHMAVSAAPILDDEGAIREWVGTHTDITERKEAEIELSAAKDAAEAANRAKSVFLANMSHELRTPLSAVIGYSEMLEEEVEELGQTDLLSDLGKIKSNARHLLSLINDVLDLSKIEANRMDVFAEDADVGVTAADVVSTVEALVKQKNNSLVLDAGSEPLGTMRTDVVKLRQCLFNLLSNAAKFTENGTITLSVRRVSEPEDGDWINFRVTDTGIGMTPEQLARLFARFSQADETTTRRFGGTGLGLAISRAFSRLIGGDIAVESTHGVGTSFTLRVPAHMPERSVDAGLEEALPSMDVDGNKGVVLVIDDDPAQRDLMSRFLKGLNFSVETAADGRTGLELARTVKPRAILLDVMMPQMDGWSVLSALKSDAELAAIPVVMITFVADHGLAASLGADEHLSKPVDWDKLKSVMDRFRDHEGDVLVVDDDRGARERLRSVLERNGWTVQEAANGAEALERVKVARPRLILLDLTMPVMDGFAFLHALRDAPNGADIPVVVLSARDMTSAERKQLEAADRVLAKGSTSLKQIATELKTLESSRYPADVAIDE